MDLSCSQPERKRRRRRKGREEKKEEEEEEEDTHMLGGSPSPKVSLQVLEPWNRWPCRWLPMERAEDTHCRRSWAGANRGSGWAWSWCGAAG